MSMQNRSALTSVRDNCKVCKNEHEICKKIRDCVQELMDQGILQLSRDKALGEVSITEPIEIVYHQK